jgi:cysteine desulfurase
LLHADAAQSAGKVPLSMKEDGFDLLTLVAHKLYGPKGVGALIVKKGVALNSVQLGAGQESGRRAGTENVASIVGFGAACVAAKRDLVESSARMISLRDRMMNALKAGVPGLVIAGEKSARLPNTIYALFPNVSGTQLLAKTPGVAASTGSACHDGHETPPQVLLEMKLSPSLALGAVRLSLGRHTTSADVDSAAAQLISALPTLWA